MGDVERAGLLGDKEGAILSSVTVEGAESNVGKWEHIIFKVEKHLIICFLIYEVPAV